MGTDNERGRQTKAHIAIAKKAAAEASTARKKGRATGAQTARKKHFS